jgi:hypothetical protein
VALFSLQKGPCAADLQDEKDHLPVTDLTECLGDFADTAAAIARLDLVITVDTAVAHLAGALGKPVWVLLPFAPDWRWLLGREDSPWYPTARLFRQTRPGDWPGVFARVGEAVAEAAATGDAAEVIAGRSRETDSGRQDRPAGPPSGPAVDPSPPVAALAPVEEEESRVGSNQKMSVCFNLVVWGEAYANLFLDIALKALLDDTNLPAIRDRAEFRIFTDGHTEQQIMAHDRFRKLRATLPVRVDLFTTEGNKYDGRYSIQAQLHKACLVDSLERNMAVSFVSPDATYGKHYCHNLIAKLDEGYSAVLGVAMRSAAEPMLPLLTAIDGAPTSEQLFHLAFKNMHPLWVASNWNSPMFSRLPYTMLWTNDNQMIARSFSLHPMMVVPTQEMLEAGSVVDCALPAMCTRPYVALDWAEFPSAGVEFLFCWYPPFSFSRADARTVAQWSKTATDERQIHHLRHVFQYRIGGDLSQDLVKESDAVVEQILYYRSIL